MKSERILHAGGILMIDGHGPYLAGVEPTGLLRTSTALVAFDETEMTACTASGRPYRLVGPEVRREAIHALLSIWELPQGARPKFLELHEVAEVIERNGNRAQSLTAEEAAEQRMQRLAIMGASIGRYVYLCERFRDLTLEDITEVSDLSLTEWRSLIEGTPADTVTVDRAEDALRMAAGVFNGEVVITPGRTP